MKRSTISMIAAAVLASGSFSAQADNNWQNEAKDAWIDGKAESTLLFNTHLNSFDINTDVKGGVVTLTGKVDTQVGKSLAEELVLSLDGVKDVHNHLTVVGSAEQEKDNKVVTELTDSKVEAVVKTRLLFESEVDGLDIDVEVDKGVVTLDGTVDSDAEKQLAIAIAENTEDVDKVVSKLKVIANS